jgi:hypothetical protein
MIRSSRLVVLVVSATVALPAYGQVMLAWKFKEGDKFYVEDVSTMKQKIGFMGMGFEQSNKTTMVTSYTVTRKVGDEVTLVQKIEGVDVKSQGGLGGDLDKMMEKLKGATFTLTLGPRGKIERFEGYAEFIKKIAGRNEEAARMVKLMVTEAVLKRGAEEMFGFLPEMPLGKGDRWKRESTIPFGQLGSLKALSEYTYDGPEKDGEAISVKSTLTYSTPKGDAGFGVVKITKGNLKSEGGRGSLVFDMDKGRRVRQSLAMVFRGSLTMDIMGNAVDMDVHIDQSSNSRTLSRNPLDSK